VGIPFSSNKAKETFPLLFVALITVTVIFCFGAKKLPVIIKTEVKIEAKIFIISCFINLCKQTQHLLNMIQICYDDRAN